MQTDVRPTELDITTCGLCNVAHHNHFFFDFDGLKRLLSDRKPFIPKSKCPLPMRERPKACLAEGAGNIDPVCCMLLHNFCNININITFAT